MLKQMTFIKTCYKDKNLYDFSEYPKDHLN